MPKIPLYQQQVVISDQAPGVMYDASAEIQAIGQIASDIAGGIENLGEGIQKGIEKFQTLEDESAIADANRLTIEFQNDMILEKQKALEDPNIGYKNYEQKVLQPRINEFRNSLLNKGYSKRVTGRILETADMDFTNMVKMERVDRVKKATENHVANIQQEAALLIMTESNYEFGVQRINDMVTNGYITKSDANTFISTANNSYFSGLAKSVTSQADIDVIKSSERFNSMPKLDQMTVESKMNESHKQYFITKEAEAIDRAAELIKEEELDPEKIAALNISNPEVVNGLMIEYEKQLAKLQAEYQEEEGTSIKDLTVLDNDIKTLFSGEAVNPEKSFNTLLTKIVSSDMDSVLKNHYLELIVDGMKTTQGFDVFAKGAKNKSVYSDDVREVWSAFWKTYDDANAFMPMYLKNRDLIETKTQLLNFLKNQKQTAMGLIRGTEKPSEQSINAFGGTGRMLTYQAAKKREDASAAVRATASRFGQLEYDSKGNLVASDANNQIILKFINSTFAPYLRYRADVALNKTLGVYIQTESDTQYQRSQPVFSSLEQEIIEATQD